MKLANFFIILFILILSFTSCKKTTVTITKPGEDISLTDIFGKIEDGTYGNLEITDGGKNIKVDGKTYTKKENMKENIGGFIGVYEDTDKSSTTGDKNDMLVIQGAGATITMPANEAGTKAIEEAFEYLGKEKATKYITEAISENGTGDGKIDTDKLLKMATDEERTELEKIFGEDKKITFGDYKIYNKS